MSLVYYLKNYNFFIGLDLKSQSTLKGETGNGKMAWFFKLGNRRNIHAAQEAYDIWMIFTRCSTFF